ncbi:MAG: WXG100 family type VII secretion target [Faecousia sp.]
MIRISPDALRAAAERQRNILSAVDETKTKMTSMTSELDQAWNGGASVQAIHTLQDLRKAADSIFDGLQDGASMLDGIAQAFEALDDGENSPLIAIRLDDRFNQRLGCPAPGPIFSLAFSGQLRIEPDQVRDVAAQCNQIAEEYVGKANELQNSLSTLESDWQGKSFTRFANMSTKLIGAFKEISEALNEFANKIRNAANRYEEIDNMF